MRSFAVYLAVFLAASIPVLAQGAEACGVCHSSHMGQWKGSPHAMAWENERFQSQLAKYGNAEFCGRCHSPLSVWEEVDTRFETKTYQEAVEQRAAAPVDYDPKLVERPAPREADVNEGVTCGSCHLIQVFSPAGKREDFVGPYHTEAGHTGRETAGFKTLRLCGACHGRDAGDYFPGGTDPGDEFHHSGNRAVTFANETANCSSCHMPRKEGRLVQLRSFKDLPRREVGEHYFAESLYESISDALSLELTGAGESAALSITNLKLGHPLQVCPETTYRLVLAPVEGKKVGEPVSLDLPQAADLGIDQNVTIPLPFSITNGKQLKVELLAKSKGRAEQSVLTKTLQTS
ncbi:MAG: hypothetical protein JSU96_20960 [Acidobacteriota bacterium]|nr:MAG: hypothetical protein JSU96_20960 [Acidobacteriota bacterium]